MKITWLGTASVLAETEGHKILFDPYLRTYNKRLPKFPLEKIDDVEAIFITHPHLDHFADIPKVMQYTHCPVYVNARGMEIAKENDFDLTRIKQIDFGAEFTFGNLSVRAYKGRHVEYDKKCVDSAVKRALKGHIVKGLKLSKVNKRFAINLDEVFTFYLREGDKTAMIMGSANKDGQTAYPETDVLIYPYQGRSDMLEYSLELVKSLSPKAVIADHFDDAFPPVSSRMNVEEFKQKLESESGIKVIIPEEYEETTV